MTEEMNKRRLDALVMPAQMKNNNYFEQFTEALGRNISIQNFRPWRLGELIKNRHTVRFIILHFPESLWRSKIIFFCLFRFIYFWCLFFIAHKILRYEVVWVAHNILPHSSRLPRILEFLARKWLLTFCHKIVFVSANGYYDASLLFPMVQFENKVINISHGVVPLGNEEVKLKGKSTSDKQKKRILMFFNGDRDNLELTTNFLRLIYKRLLSKNIEIIVYGDVEKLPQELENDFLLFKPGRLCEEELDDVLRESDFFLFLYKTITNSGWFYKCIQYQLVVIAPNLSFYSYNVPDEMLVNFDLFSINEHEIENLLRKVKDKKIPGEAFYHTLLNEHDFNKAMVHLKKELLNHE